LNAPGQPVPLVIELAQIRKQAEANQAYALTLVEGLSEQQLAWRPEPRRWSIADNFVHLRLTVQMCLGPLDAAIASARERKLFSNGPFRMTLMGRLFAWYVEPPPAIRLPAPKTLVPPLQGSASEALPAWIVAHTQIVERIEAANGLDLVRASFTSPFASFVRMNLLALFAVFNGHERRHLWQANNVRSALLSLPQR